MIGEFFFGKRWTPLKWIAIIPGLVAFVFLGHAFEDAGLFGALPYIAIVAISIGYLFRPRVILWIFLFGSFALFAVMIAVTMENGLMNEWFLTGVIPAILMLFAWPMKIR